MGLIDKIRQNYASGNTVQIGRKALYDLHPELLDREPIMRVWSDDEENRWSDWERGGRDYAGHVWVHKAVNTVATNIAPLQLTIIDTATGEPVSAHPLLDLLAHINDRLSPADLWRQWTVSMLLGGELGLELVRGKSSGKFKEVWPRNPNQFSVRVAKGNERLYDAVRSYQIGDGQSEPFMIPREEFVHWKFYNPLVPFRGIAPISAVRMGILIDEYSQAWSRLFFSNSARPDFVALVPQGFTTTERDNLEAKFAKKYRGLEKSHGIVVLEDGIVDVKPLNWTPKDTEWLEQRKIAREEIGAIFGVPDEVMGWGRDTYENFAQAMRAFWVLTLVPLVGMRDDTLTNFFQQIGQLAPNLKFATDLSGVEVLQTDRKEKADLAKLLFDMGVPFNQINAQVGLGVGDIPGGDVGYLPLALMPVGSSLSVPEPAKAAGKAVNEYNSPEHKALWLLFNAKTEPREKQMIRLLKRSFRIRIYALRMAWRN